MIVVWNIVKVFWFKREKRFLEGTNPWGMSKQGSLRKSFFFNLFFTQLQSTPLKNTDRTAQNLCPLDLSVRVAGCSAASERIAMWPFHGHCWLYDGAKTDQTYCSELLVHMPRLDDHIVFLCFLCYCFYCHSHITKRECHLFPNLSSFQSIPIFLLVF